MHEWVGCKQWWTEAWLGKVKVIVLFSESRIDLFIWFFSFWFPPDSFIGVRTVVVILNRGHDYDNWCTLVLTALPPSYYLFLSLTLFLMHFLIRSRTHTHNYSSFINISYFISNHYFINCYDFSIFLHIIVTHYFVTTWWEQNIS